MKNYCYESAAECFFADYVDIDVTPIPSGNQKFIEKIIDLSEEAKEVLKIICNAPNELIQLTNLRSIERYLRKKKYTKAKQERIINELREVAQG